MGFRSRDRRELSNAEVADPRMHIGSLNAPRMLEWGAANTHEFQVGCFETGFSDSSADLFNKRFRRIHTASGRFRRMP